MRFFIKLGVLLSLLFVVLGCSCDTIGSKKYKIGLDPSWYSINSDGQEKYISGFFEDFLLDISRKNNIIFEKFVVSSNELLDDLNKEKYDAIITNINLYNFYQEQYDFSNVCIPVQSVLIIKTDSKFRNILQLSDKVVGYVIGGKENELIVKNPAIITRGYSSVPDVLEALVNEQVDAAKIGIILANRYLQDIYYGRLKMLNVFQEEGLRFVCLKNKETRLISIINKELKNKNIVNELKQKWKLP